MAEVREFVQAHTEGPIGYVTIDRPPVNAYNLQTHREIRLAFEDLVDDPDLRCAILCAAGVSEGRPFGAGSDVNEFVDLDPRNSLARSREIRRCFASVTDFPLPVIAAVENVCLGSGWAYSARADIRVISESVVVAMPEIQVGALGGSRELIRQVGPGKARELYYTGRRIPAEEAFRHGYGEHLVPAGEALATARTIAEEIALMGPFALQLAKQQMKFAESPLNRDEALQYETELTALLRATPESHEAARAFVGKRRPNFDE